MKQLNVDPLYNCNAATEIKVVSFLLDSVKRNTLNYAPWKEYAYIPAVEFAIAYSADAVFLKYYVNEKAIRAINTEINTAVWEDSCVEFFISFDSDASYYNLEFNCIGTSLAGYGTGKHDRKLLPATLISQIKYQTVIDNHAEDGIHWELTVSIPKNLFCFNEINSFAGLNCKANFYKCGDKLLLPHFIAWSNIQSEEPNFHLQDFFGALHFI